MDGMGNADDPLIGKYARSALTGRSLRARYIPAMATDRLCS